MSERNDTLLAQIRAELARTKAFRTIGKRMEGWTRGPLGRFFGGGYLVMARKSG